MHASGATCALGGSLLASLLMLGCGRNGPSNQEGFSCGCGDPLQAGGAGTIYVVEGDDSFTTSSVLIFPTAETGTAAPQSTLTLSPDFIATSVTVDASGQIYVCGLTHTEVPEILVFSAGAGGNASPSRTIQVTPGIAYSYPIGVALDSSGTIYAQGAFGDIVVYSANASGNVAPLRTILPPSSLLTAYSSTDIAVDSAGNLYVAMANATGGALAVYTAGANGSVSPARLITDAVHVFTSVVLDAAANLYVGTGNFSQRSAANPTGSTAAILEFGAGATGAATPLRTISTTNNTDIIFIGMRMDRAGNFYAISQKQYGDGTALYEFGPAASGVTTPAAVLTSNAMGDDTTGGMDLH